MIDHIELWVSDLGRPRAFCDAALAPLGIRILKEAGPESGRGSHLGYGRTEPAFWIGTSQPAGGPVHVAFAAPDRATVADFHAAALAAGGRDNGRPGPRPEYHPGYYGAFVLDPDGNNIEAVFHGDRP
ncbi:VOC family protein [Paracoccus yeei]|uniref:VOC family protein n=1 Tax=Paracoccus yeei TaxID=147645 RepID=UPI0004906CF0|nr:VOC family protein [Paracoccus yeei]OWJ97503.1 glyoxalase/bleomycin resistance/extradiol dioxygenase family protein [Paracoccus yeei]